MIDNEVVENPEIQCNDKGITFSVRTRNPFRQETVCPSKVGFSDRLHHVLVNCRGNVYVRGQFGIPRCRKEVS